MEVADLNWKALILSRVAPGLSTAIQLKTIFNPNAIVGTIALLLELRLMVDWLVVWGIAQAAGFVFKPILEDLAKESAKDYAKDFFKDCLKKVIRLPEKDVQKEAYGKALKEFLQLVQDELEDADYQDAQIKQYIQPLQKFIKQEAVAAALGRAFEADCRGLDIALLNQTWRGLELPHLPETFDWERVSKRYCRKVKAIVQESDKLRPIFEAQAQEKMAEGVQELVGIAPAFDLSRYAEGLREQYGNLKLESLDTTGVYYSELQLWKIFIPQTVRECQEFLPQFYEIPKDQMRRLRQSGQVDEIEIAEVELEQHRRVYGEQLPQSVLEVVGDPGVVAEMRQTSLINHAVILGDPGSGKSTLLQYMALVWAERPLIELSLHPIPLLIELRSYARDKQAGLCRDMLTFLHSGNITCRLNQQELHDKLTAGEAIALFDGIDEVFDPTLRDQVVTDIHRFTNDYPAVQVVVTSRWLGYKAQRLRDAGFRHFMLQDLEAEQIEAFMQRWHDLTFVEGADKQRKQARLQKAIRDSKAIRELAGNPLLLTMMAILNRNQELPRDRPRLYERASEVLLYQWDVEAKVLEDPKLKDLKITVDLKDKQAMLRKIAYHMQSSAKGLAGNLISRTDLENLLTDYLRTIVERGEPRMVARIMIDQLRTRNFILCYLGADSYAFVHRTFLEYFCAWEFVWQFKETQTLTIEQLKQDVLGQHWRDETWHEVMRLISGMIDASFAGKLLEFLLEQQGQKEKFINLFLAAKCLAEVSKRVEIHGVVQRLLSQIQALTNYDLDYYYQKHLDEEETKLVFEIRTQAVSAVAETWQEEGLTYPWLKTRAQSDEDSDVRCAAVQALAQGWKDDPETLVMLRTWAQSDEDSNVRRAAVQALARGWKDDPETLVMLKTWAQSNEDLFVRFAAVQELAQGWKDDPETLVMLRTWAQSDEHFFMRFAAVQELARGWKDDPETLVMLKTWAQSDEDSNVRFAAVQELARGWKDDPETLVMLKTWAQSDEDSNVRGAAVQELARGWKDDPETLVMLRTRAQSDEHFFVRRAAVQELARGWKDSPGIFELFLDRALHDPYERGTGEYSRYETNPRQTALEAILKNYPDYSQTLELLNDRANNDPDEQTRDFAKRKRAELERQK